MVRPICSMKDLITCHSFLAGAWNSVNTVMIGIAVALLSIYLPIHSFHPCKQKSITACGRTHSLLPFSRAFSYDHKNRKCHWLSFDSLTPGVRTEKDFNFDLYEKKGRSSSSSSTPQFLPLDKTAKVECVLLETLTNTQKSGRLTHLCLYSWLHYLSRSIKLSWVYVSGVISRGGLCKHGTPQSVSQDRPMCWVSYYHTGTCGEESATAYSLLKLSST